MKFLVVGKVTSNQVDRLKEEAEKRGHSLDNCSAHDLVLISESGKFEPRLYEQPFGRYDLIYILTVGKRRWEWYSTCKYIREEYGTVIIESKTVDPNAIYHPTPVSEFIAQSQANIPFPKTATIQSLKGIVPAMKEFSFPLIIKIGDLHRGEGVYKANSLQEIRSAIKNNPRAPFYLLREFIPNDGDIRIFVIAGKAVGALKRIAAPGEFRNNISLGGSGHAFDLKANPLVQEIAEKTAEINNIEIAGVDIILHQDTGKPYVLEINRSPQFRGLEQYAKINAAAKIIEYFESRVS